MHYQSWGNTNTSIGKNIFSNPYDYDPFVLFSTEEKPNQIIYSDRMFEQNCKRYNSLCLKHFGNKSQYWDEREPAKIEQFLRDWCIDEKIKLVLIEQQCNVSTGYPLWKFGIA